MLLTEVQVRQYWRFSWRFSTPAILFALLVFSWWQNLFLILLILVYIWPELGLLVGFLLSSTRSEFGHISYQGQPYPTWVQVPKSILHTHQEEIILNQISTLCYRVICLNPGDGISDHWLHSGGSAHFWSNRGDWKNQDYKTAAWRMKDRKTWLRMRVSRLEDDTQTPLSFSPPWYGLRSSGGRTNTKWLKKNCLNHLFIKIFRLAKMTGLSLEHDQITKELSRKKQCLLNISVPWSRNKYHLCVHRLEWGRSRQSQLFLQVNTNFVHCL